jgi:hypothetical protein
MIKKLPLVPEPMPLVKEFKNDDPTTYLSNPEQQRNMLLPLLNHRLRKWMKTL